jgi:hypothetical protein
VATNILGKSGRAMLDALAIRTTDPEVLADLAKGKLRAKLPASREALEGRLDQLHAVSIGALLNHIDFPASRPSSSRARSRKIAASSPPLNCARFPAFNDAPPRRSSPRSPST